jgi:cell division protein FtsB
MSRNRKSQSVASRFGPAVKAFLLCLLIGGSGVGYVWQKEQLARLGQQIKIRESRLAALEDQNEQLKKQLAFMRSPRFLEARIKEWNLGLVQPQPGQIWRLNEPAPEPASSEQSRQYAQGEHMPLFQ